MCIYSDRTNILVLESIMKFFFSFFKHLKLGLKTIPKDLKKPFCLKYKKIPCIYLVLLLNTKDTKNTNSGFSLFQNNKNNTKVIIGILI